MAQQQLAMNACGWCGEAPWTYSCAMCDPRRTKRVCDECAKRWHSRGFSQQHVLSNCAGEMREFRVWFRSFLGQPPADALPLSGSGDAPAVACEQQFANGDQRAPLSRTPSEVIELQVDVDENAKAEQVPITSSTSTSDNNSMKGDDAESTEGEETEEEIPQALEEKLLPLNELLARFPSEEPRLVDMLSEYINAAMRIQDGIACMRFTKCTQLPCTSVVAHFRHNTNGDAPCDTECRLGLEIFQHMKTCSEPGCLLCIRVRLRKALNSIRAIEVLVLSQKKLMQQLLQEHKGGASDAQVKYDLCSSQVRYYERKRLQLIEGVEEMNTMVLDLRLPIFNFPRPVWHIHYEPLIKTEQIEPTISSEHVVEQTAPATQEESFLQSTDADADVLSDEDLVDRSNDSNNTNFTAMGADYIRVLLDKKKNVPQAQQKFDESIDLAYAIVEASFCSPAKAPRCLLQCQTILDHLQHHLDLKVCQDIMCTTVEFHFAHLSMCSEKQESATCEYCLRVQEREFMRALDMMEGELRKAEAKAQAVLNEMSASVANDSHEEREDAIEQLEDELEQAEDYKRDMAKKLSTARMNLREVRERMETLAEPIATSAFQTLPLHFVKVPRKDAQSKKRKQ